MKRIEVDEKTFRRLQQLAGETKTAGEVVRELLSQERIQQEPPKEKTHWKREKRETEEHDFLRFILGFPLIRVGDDLKEREKTKLLPLQEYYRAYLQAVAERGEKGLPPQQATLMAFVYLREQLGDLDWSPISRERLEELSPIIRRLFGEALKAKWVGIACQALSLLFKLGWLKIEEIEGDERIVLTEKGKEQLEKEKVRKSSG
ncbi:MAG: hypothetical protein QXH08_00235 [Candidatus Hadarchaeales archaeon]